MIHFGFSYIGLLYLIMLMVPNLIWTKHKPKGYEEYVVHENKVLLTLERIGEVLVSCIALIFSDFNLRRVTAWSVWLVISFVCMILYEIYWIRYFKSEQTMQDFYRGLLLVPVAGATYPVFAFFLLGIYGSNLPMIISTVILGIGHIGIHLMHAREVCGERKKRPILLRIGKGILAAAFILIFGVIAAVIGFRNVHSFKHIPNLIHGVDEGIYLSLNGQEQYVLMTGQDVSNPVIIYLHGGPSSPDTYCTYSFADAFTDEYTFVSWDQRGCGRTYFYNSGIDPENETATFEQAEEDLDALVDYVCDRFGKQQVIIMGHSYGTILGSQYALSHPEKVSMYIGVAQVTSLNQTDIYSYEDALKKAAAQGDDTGALEAAYARYQEDGSLVRLMELRSLVAAYHPVAVQDDETWMAVTSPYFGMDDFKWFLKQLGSIEDYYALNQQLFDYTFEFDAFDEDMEYQMPAYFISGSDDWICPVDSVTEYVDAIQAPDKELFLLEGCGHNVQYALPEEFGEIVKGIAK